VADTILGGEFAALDFVLTVNVFSTSPVGQAELGITPDLEDPFNYPPLYQGSPVSAANLVLDEIAGAGSGLIVGVLPTPPGPLTPSSPGISGLSGGICELYEGDLYGRIIITPTVMDFGNVLQQTSRVLEVWNSFLVSKTLNSITEVDTFGLTLIRPLAAPTEPAVYTALQSLIYTVQVDTVGPAAVDASFTFVFASGETPVLAVIGQRVVSFPYCYERPFNETLEFLTNVMESTNGSEQRVAARQQPRQAFKAQYIVDNVNDRQRLLNASYGFHGKFFAVPLFHWARQLTADAATTDTRIFVDYANADFRNTTSQQEYLIMLWRSPSDFEISQIALNGLAVPGQIDLQLGLAGNHASPATLVVPLQFALSKDPFQFTETQNNIVTVNVNWLSNDPVDLGDVSSLPVLDGIPVLASNNLMEGRLSQGFKIKYQLIDSTVGLFQSVVDRTVPETFTTLGIEVATEAEAWTLRKILYGLRGKQKTFWLPTFRNDFTISQTIGPADTEISFVENDFHRFVEGGPDPWGGIYIELFDGTQIFRTIVGTTAPSAGEESVTIGTSLGVTILVPEIRRASLLVRSRFATDRISIKHLRVGNIQLRIPVVGVKESV